ncbi:CBS domain-containing protein, partial [Halorubrum ezzemoulense]|uniref:CBS domain-containing protein n=1 Tax=Halorubrum ezzemoulense TaxID=337243 RepID=UPI0023314A96
ATNGYDAAPVERDGDPVGFIHKDDVDDADTGDTLEAALTPLTIDYMISGDTSFSESLEALIEEPVYFLGGHNRITGVLTRADLNTPPARMYLFDRITYLEEHLRALISAEVSEWRQTPGSADEIEGIEDRYADAKAANVELSEIHYAQFSTLSTIVSSVEDCWRVCGFSTRGNAQSRLHDITELRNDV